MKINIKNTIFIIISSMVIAILVSLLVYYGNPTNMGLSVSCFIKDMAGSLRLHNTPIAQYYRPEIVGIFLGAFLVSLFRKRFNLSISNNWYIYLIYGFCTMILCMIFLGCPFRMIERMAGGDLNAYIGFFGLVLGIVVSVFVKKEKKEVVIKEVNKKYIFFILPIVLIVGFIVLVVDTYCMPGGSKIFATSTAGPASMHANIFISLIFSLIIGVILSISELSFDNAVIGIIKHKNYTMLLSGIIMFIAMMIFNHFNYTLNFNFDEQIVAHKAIFWNFLSMFGVGVSIMFAGGDPLRQLIKSAEGKIDSLLYILGMFIASIIIYPLRLTGAAYSMLPNGSWFVGGPVTKGKIACFLCIIVILIIGIINDKYIFGASNK